MCNLCHKSKTVYRPGAGFFSVNSYRKPQRKVILVTFVFMKNSNLCPENKTLMESFTVWKFYAYFIRMHFRFLKGVYIMLIRDQR